MSRDPPSKWCRVVRVREAKITRPEDVWQPQPNSTCAIDKKDRHLKHSAFEMASRIHFFKRGPSLLGYDGSAGFMAVIIQKQSRHGRDDRQGSLHILSIACDIPGAMIKHYPIIFQEVWCPKKEHKVVVGILGSKCTRNETTDKSV